MTTIYFLKDFKLWSNGKLHSIKGGKEDCSVKLNFAKHCDTIDPSLDPYLLLTSNNNGFWTTRISMLDQLIKEGFLSLGKPSEETFLGKLTGKRPSRPKNENEVKENQNINDDIENEVDGNQ